MKVRRHRYTRAEKALILGPLLLFALAAGLWQKQRRATQWIALPGQMEAATLVFSPDSRYLAALSHASGLVLDVGSSAKICDFKAPLNFGYASSLEWSRDGRRIVMGYSQPMTPPFVVATMQGMMAVWDSRSGVLLHQWPYGDANVDSEGDAHFSRDGQTLVGNGVPPSLFEAATGKRVRKFHATFPLTEGGSFDAKLKWVAIRGDSNRQIEVREVASNRVVWGPKPLHSSKIAWSDDGILFVCHEISPDTLNYRGQLTLWDGPHNQFLPSPPATHVLKFSLNARQPLVALADVEMEATPNGLLPVVQSKLVVWDYRKARAVWQYPMQQRFEPLWSPDGRWLAVAEDMDTNSGGFRLRIFDAAGGLREECKRPLSSQSGLSWSPDSQKLAVSQQDGVEIFDARTF